MCEYHNTNNEILQEQKWGIKKMASLKLSKAYSVLGAVENNPYFSRKSERIEDCGSVLAFRQYETGERRLHSANFCRVRLCPMCAWRRSLKIYGQTTKVIQEYEKKYVNFKPILITLTVKNCTKEELDSVLNQMFKAFNRFTKYEQISKMNNGYFRALEITYNWEKDTYHPHFHCIFMVNKNYFSGRDYMKKSDYAKLWQKALKVDYEPVVDVRKVKDMGAIAEVSKYAVKEIENYIGDNLEVLKVLDSVIHRRRLVSYGGEFKKIHKLLNLDDIENGDLINTDNEQEKAGKVYEILIYMFNIGVKNYMVFAKD